MSVGWWWEPTKSGEEQMSVQMTLFEARESEVEKELKQLDVESLTPLEALTKLDELKKRL